MPPGPARLIAPTSPRAFRTRTTPSATGTVTVPPAATATGRVPPGPVTVACTAVSPGVVEAGWGGGPAGHRRRGLGAERRRRREPGEVGAPVDRGAAVGRRG